MKLLASAGACLFAVAIARGQELLSLPQSPLNPLPNAGSLGESQVTSYQQAAQQYLQSATPFRLGNLNVSPHAVYTFTEGNDLLTAPGETGNSAVETASAGVLFQDRQWVMDYTADSTWYSNPALQSEFAQQARLAGTETFGEVVAGVADGYSQSSQVLLSTGRQTPVQDNSTSFTLSASGQGFQWLDFSASQDLSRSTVAANTSTWNVQDWIHFPLTEKLGTAIGASAGYSEQHPGVDTEQFDPEMLLSWTLTKKLQFSAEGGWERQEVLSRPPTANSTFVASVAAAYAVTATTSVQITANRSLQPSDIGGEDACVSTVGLALNQRLLGHYQLTANASRGQTQYSELEPPSLIARTDNTLGGGATLGTTLLHRIQLSVNYQTVRDQSSAAGFAFTSRQYGFTVGISY